MKMCQRARLLKRRGPRLSRRLTTSDAEFIGEAADRMPSPDEDASGHVTPADGNLFEDLGYPSDEAMRLLADADAGLVSSFPTDIKLEPPRFDIRLRPANFED